MTLIDLFPAQAGVILLVDASYIRLSPIPRASGGYPSFSGPPTASRGYSPRKRGLSPNQPHRPTGRFSYSPRKRGLSS